MNKSTVYDHRNDTFFIIDLEKYGLLETINNDENNVGNHTSYQFKINYTLKTLILSVFLLKRGNSMAFNKKNFALEKKKITRNDEQCCTKSIRF